MKAITTKLFERDGVSETQFINVKDIATNASAFSSWITSNNICWTPDFGTWPSCSGSVPGSGGNRGAGGSSSTGGRGGAGGSSTSALGTGGRVGTGGSTSIVSRADAGGGTSTVQDNGGASGVGGEVIFRFPEFGASEGAASKGKTGSD